MRLRPHHLLLVAAAVAWACIPHPPAPGALDAEQRERAGRSEYPSDYFYLQRALPDGTIPSERYAAAVEQLEFERALDQQALGTSSVQDWVPVGPNAIGGRVNAIVAAP